MASLEFFRQKNVNITLCKILWQKIVKQPFIPNFSDNFTQF